MRKDQKLAEEYKKNQRFEDVLTSMNEQLSVSQDEILLDLQEKFATIHILGAPRSGTTLVSQLIPSELPIGYINNLIAAFWKAPIYGVELSKKLISEEYKSNFQSDFGRTKGIQEPHEFGYFWNYHLKYETLAQKDKSHEKNIDWDSLTGLLKNMTYSYDKPILFKSFLLGFHAHTLYKYLAQTRLIYIRRKLADNALSLLKLRKKLNGDINSWGSIKPLQYELLKGMSVYEQVVGQILCLEYEYLIELENIPNENKLYCNYEDICENPQGFLNDVKVKFLNDSISHGFDNLSSFSVRSSSSEVEKKEIEQAKKKVLNVFPYLKNIR